VAAEALAGARRPVEHHPSIHRIGGLRTGVLAASDGIVSTASLVIGVAAAHAGHQAVVLTAVAGLVSGAMAMAAARYLAVRSQNDSETADQSRERIELAAQGAAEHRELTAIYVARGVEPALARQVAQQLKERDALDADAREQIGSDTTMRARPIQDAMASAAGFCLGALLPLVVTSLAPPHRLMFWEAVSAIGALASLGFMVTRTRGAGRIAAAWRVSLWGALAMAVTAAVGAGVDALSLLA
jgi:VIT1/CCC1 family predicted Fe2+/Mn2+ transporter